MPLRACRRREASAFRRRWLYQREREAGCENRHGQAMEQKLGDEVRASPYFAEGVAAFREKR